MVRYGLEVLHYCTHLFLLHQLRIWAVIHDLFSKDWRGERTVYVLCTDVFELPIEYEFVSLYPQADCRLLPEQDECEDVTVLKIVLAMARCFGGGAISIPFPDRQRKTRMDRFHRIRYYQ